MVIYGLDVTAVPVMQYYQGKFNRLKLREQILQMPEGKVINLKGKITVTLMDNSIGTRRVAFRYALVSTMHTMSTLTDLRNIFCVNISALLLFVLRISVK